jgi:hypothetical protein
MIDDFLALVLIMVEEGSEMIVGGDSYYEAQEPSFDLIDKTKKAIEN